MQIGKHKKKDGYDFRIFDILGRKDEILNDRQKRAIKFLESLDIKNPLYVDGIGMIRDPEEFIFIHKLMIEDEEHFRRVVIFANHIKKQDDKM